MAFHGFVFTYSDSTGTHWLTFPPFNDFYLRTPPLSPATADFNTQNGYDVYRTPVDLVLNVEGAAMDSSGQIATVSSCSAPIAITAVLTPTLPSYNTAPPLTWTGGSPGPDSMHRIVPCTIGDTLVQAAIGTSLAASVTIKVPLTITMSPNTFTIGVSGLRFSIDGANFGSGVPTLEFGASGIANVIVTSHSDSSVAGTFDVPAASSPGQYTVRLTPFGSTQSGTTTLILLASTPTITGVAGLWYLGAASVNDNCVPGSTDASEACYKNTTTLAVSSAPTPSSNSPATWLLTDHSTGQQPSFVSQRCDDTACAQTTITATSYPPACGAVDVQVTVNGLSSAPYTIYVDWPSTATAVFWQDLEFNDSAYLGYTGYLSNNTLLLKSGCNQRMFGIDVHEEFPGAFRRCGAASAGWATAVDAMGSWRTLTGNNAGFFGPDQVAFAYPPGYDTPQPQCPGKPITGQCVEDPVPPQQLSPQANAYAQQFIFVGSQSTQPAGKWFTTAPNMQVRYTDHGRDEVGTWTCPAQ